MPPAFNYVHLTKESVNFILKGGGKSEDELTTNILSLVTENTSDVFTLLFNADFILHIVLNLIDK